MKRDWRLAVMACMAILLLISGCAKKTSMSGEISSQKPATEMQSVVKAPDKDVSTDDEAKRRAAEERAAKAKADREAAAKAGAVKEAAAKKLHELSDIHFDYDKFNLRDDARAILNEHASWLNKNKDAKVTVEGHCDERGTAEYNLALGERRASAAAKYLSDMGIEGKRISTISYGVERPLDPGHNEEAWAKNRRAHFVISGMK